MMPVEPAALSGHFCPLKVNRGAILGRARRKDALERRENIIDAAEFAFARSGYEVPLEDICKLADVGRGTLYRNFSSRLDLVHAIMSRNVEKLEKVAAHVADAPGGLFTYLDEVMRQQVRTGGMVYLIGLDEELDRDLAMRFRASLSGLLDSAKARGEVRASVDIEDVALVAGMMWGGLQRHNFDERLAVAPKVQALAIAALQPRAETSPPTPL